jgi:uncharacterized membrane protein YphA (DoxX/SURF4 family)
MRLGRPTWFPLLGLSFAVAGADKLFGAGGYDRLPRDLGWPEDALRWVAAGEVAGGVLVAGTSTRRLGGALLTAASAAMLVGEVRRGQPRLALPRLAMLVAGLTAVLPRR